MRKQPSTTKQINLKSSVTALGKKTTQVFHAVSGVKATYSGILTESIKEGEMLKMMCEDGRMLIINKANLFFTEVFPENED